MRPGEDVGQAAFIQARPEFARDARPGDIIVAGPNFGCGSSREYAAEALHRRGIAAIVAVSFARIFFRNAVNLGIPVVPAPELVATLEDGDEVCFDSARRRLVTPRRTFAVPEPPAFVDEIIRAGGIVEYVRATGHFPGEG